MKRYSLICILFFCLIFSGFSQNVNGQSFWSEYVSRNWTAAEGLPGNTINDIIQDNKGYIYIGTYDGLVRFDGVNFYVMNKATIPEFNVVSARCVFEDSKGNLWVGSNDEGLVKISNRTYTVFTMADGLPSNSVRDITEDKNGNIWIGTSSGVVFINNHQEIITPFKSDDVGLFVNEIYCDTANRIWIACSNSTGLYTYTSGTFEKLHGYPQLTSNIITSIAQDKRGAFWFGLVSGGAIKLEDGELFLLGKEQKMIGDTVNHIYVDASDAVWFATEKGVVLLKHGDLSYYTEEQGLCDNNVTKILEDREGNIWLATDRGGVEKMSPGKFKTINIPTSVNCIAEDSTGKVWLGTDNGLLCYYKGKFIENELTRMCKDIRIRHVGQVADKSLLVCAYSKYGLIKMSPNGSIQYWNQSKGLAGDRTRVAITTSDKKTYVGTTSGLSVIDSNGKITNYTRSDGLENEFIMCLYEADDGSIWIGTDGGGISVLKDNQFVKSFNTKQIIQLTVHMQTNFLIQTTKFLN